MAGPGCQIAEAASALHLQKTDSTVTLDSMAVTAGFDEFDSLADSGYTPRMVAPVFLEDSTVEDEEPSAAGDSSGTAIRADSSGARDTSANASVRKTDSSTAAAIDTTPKIKPADADIRPAWLYPGLSLEQHSVARQMLGFFYDFDWNSAEKSGKKLQRLEKKRHLPPLSYLLMIGMRVLRVQYGDYEDEHAKKNIFHDIDKLSARGLELADPAKSADSCLATNLLITGGIKGFVATLDIDRNPINAALNGLSALKFLEKAADRDTGMSDACLGLGLFNCVLAKAPFLVRGALAVFGRDASFVNGLALLRRSAERGCYTNEIAKLYLVQFLSPYLGSEAREKQKLLRSLGKAYPQNSYFVFLELEENLCFHPSMLFSFSFKERIKRQIGRFTTSDDNARRYVNLVKWQYLLIDPFPSAEMTPDKQFNLRGFEYYPVFLQALREKILHQTDSTENKKDRDRRVRFIKANGIKAARMLDSSELMPASRKGLFQWHIRDALRIDNEQKK